MRPGASQPCAVTHEQSYSSCFGDRGAREDLAGYWYGKNIHPDDKCWDNCVLVGARRRKEHDHYHQYEKLILFYACIYVSTFACELLANWRKLASGLLLLDLYRATGLCIFVDSFCLRLLRALLACPRAAPAMFADTTLSVLRLRRKNE